MSTRYFDTATVSDELGKGVEILRQQSMTQLVGQWYTNYHGR